MDGFCQWYIASTSSIIKPNSVQFYRALCIACNAV